MNLERMLLRLIDRVDLLEEEVALLKSQFKQGSENPETDEDVSVTFSDSSGKDTTKYMFNGKKYGKNRLVLAIVKKYMELNPNTSANQLMVIFDKSLQGSFGVIEKLSNVKNFGQDRLKRFFIQPDEVIHTSTDECVVCTQWGIGNIENIITIAKQLGFEITKVK